MGIGLSEPICRICCDMPVSAVEIPKPLMASRDVNRAPNGACTSLFMDAICLAPVERRNEFFNELCRDYKERTMQLNNLRKVQKIDGNNKDTNPKEKKMSSEEVRGSRSFLNKGHRRRRFKLPLSRNCRQIMEDSQDNLCQAVQEMQLNSESLVRKSECMQSGDKFLGKVGSPSEIAEDLSKLCMKD